MNGCYSMVGRPSVYLVTDDVTNGCSIPICDVYWVYILNIGVTINGCNIHLVTQDGVNIITMIRNDCDKYCHDNECDISLLTYAEMDVTHCENVVNNR